MSHITPTSPPKSAAQILATEAFKNVKEALERADQAVKDAMGPAADFEKELPGDGAHPLSALIHAREQLENARRGVVSFLDYGMDNPVNGRLGTMMGRLQVAEHYRGPRER